MTRQVLSTLGQTAGSSVSPRKHHQNRKKSKINHLSPFNPLTFALFRQLLILPPQKQVGEGPEPHVPLVSSDQLVLTGTWARSPGTGLSKKNRDMQVQSLCPMLAHGRGFFFLRKNSLGSRMTLISQMETVSLHRAAWLLSSPGCY